MQYTPSRRTVRWVWYVVALLFAAIVLWLVGYSVDATMRIRHLEDGCSIVSGGERYVR